MKTIRIPERRALQTLVLLLMAVVAIEACDNSSFYTILGNKIQVPQLALSPATATVPANGSTTFSASGGVPPYTFSIVSGPGVINGSTGVYTAPASPGVAIVQVTDKQGSTASAIVNPVNYAITAVNNTGTLFAGGPANGNFTIKNQGSSNGTQTISWTIYASPTSTLGAGSAVIASGTTTPLNSGLSATLPFGGTWPTTAGNYYLIASIYSPDSSGAALASTTPFSIVTSKVDYAVSSVTSSVASTTPGGPVSGSFILTNNGPNAGTQNVTWQVYASTSQTLSASPAPVPLALGVTTPLAKSGTATISFPPMVWPLVYGNYYLVVSVSVQVDQDTNLTNNIGATTSSTPVGIYIAKEPNDPYPTAYATGIAFVPGMSISVSGTLSVSDPSDLISFTTAAAGSTMSFTMSWTSGPADATLNVLDSTGAQITSNPPATNTTTVSFSWTVDAAGAVRYINPVAGLLPPGPYTLIITAN